MNENEKLLGKRDCAKLLSMSIRSIERMIAAGQVRAIKIRGRVLLRASDIHQLMQKGTA